VANYTIPFANAHISEQTAHRVQYKIVPTGGTGCYYKIITAKYEIIGSNVFVLNEPTKYSVYYCNGIYYVSKCEQGYSNYLVQSISGLNLNAPYTQHKETAMEQQFCHSYQRIDGVWQPVYLGFYYRNGIGSSTLVNFNDNTKMIVMSYTYGFDYLPNLNTSYGGVAIFANNGILYYYDVNADFSSRATRTLESGVSYYVNVTGVKIMHNSFSSYPTKAKFVATRKDGSNVFFSSVSSFYKIELGFGANISANYANQEGTIINVFMKVYDQLVKKVLTLNTVTNRYELTSETALGTWKKYFISSTVTN
jgi:hypothetical protein